MFPEALISHQAPLDRTQSLPAPPQFLAHGIQSLLAAVKYQPLSTLELPTSLEALSYPVALLL